MTKIRPVPHSIEVERATTPSNELRALIEELDQHLFARYLPEQQHALSLEELFQPHIHFFIAQKNGTALGCGGVALFDSFAEVKRLYVRENARGTGIADAIMAKLEKVILMAKLTTLRLETGTNSPEALAFYRRWGFQTCEAFAPYISMTPEEIAGSVFMEKKFLA